MINTVNIKQQQLQKGYFKIGSGPDNVFIMGSCRVVNFVNYFAAMPQFTVYSIDPFNWNWDVNDDRVDYIGALKQQETNGNLLDMLAGCKIFIHEWYENAGMFNISTIYNFGLNPEIDICIPNWNDVFVLFQDIVNFDVDIRKSAAQDYNVIGKISDYTKQLIKIKSLASLEKFFKICSLSSFPEMAAYFNTNVRNTRLFWTYNHTSKAFTLALFKMINEKFFNGELTVDESHQDMFANNYTHLTEYDTSFNWDEERK